MKNNLARMEADKRNLEENLGRAENRASKLELQRMSMDGDLQRLQMILQEKDAGIQVRIVLLIFLRYSDFPIFILK